MSIGNDKKPSFNWGDLAFGLLGLVPKIIEGAADFRERAQQSGEWTPDQEAEYRARREGIFAKHEHDTPPARPEPKP